MVLYSLYKKHHWLVAGPTFYQLHLLFDKHAEEQNELIDLLAERVQSLGGIAVGDPRHAAELTSIPRPPDGAEEVAVMIDRTLHAHEIVIEKVRAAITATEESKDWGTNDLLMGDVLRRHELQVWFLSEHVVDVPLVAADGPPARSPRLPAAGRAAGCEDPAPGARRATRAGRCGPGVGSASETAPRSATRRAAATIEAGRERPCQPSARVGWRRMVRA